MAVQSASAGSKPKETTVDQKRRQENIAGWTFMAPAVLILFVFLVFPLVIAFFISLTDWNGITPIGREGAFEFVGFENYVRLLFREGVRQESFYVALKNTIYYVIGVVPLQTALALVLAVIVNQKWLKGKGIFRTTFYFPSITSSVVISLIFMWLFSSGGLVNLFLGSILPNFQNINWINNPNGLLHMFLGVFGITRDTVGDWASAEFASVRLWDWISGPSVTMFMIMMLNVWTTIGTMMIIYLSALQSIPGQVYEAAGIDGASPRQVFMKITVPLLAPTTFFVVTVGLIGAFQVFDQVAIITNGGPADTTLTIAYLVFSSAFTDQRMGLAAATAVVLFVMIFVFTLIQRRFVSDRNKM
jgi:multiple sugar transport system permease protein